jgi:hypothetical protein
MSSAALESGRRLHGTRRQRHLNCREILGELDGDLSVGFDEGLHTKAVYVCRLAQD